MLSQQPQLPNKTVTPTVNNILSRAASFRERHKNDRTVQLTFGYFTHHPVAPLNKKRLRYMLENLQKRSGELGRPLRVLDLACGGGLITCAIAALGHRTLGMDLSTDEIRWAQAFAHEENLNGMFVQADLLGPDSWERTAEEILGGKPDVITLAYALHHLPDVEAFVSRLSRWLDAGAQLLINEENPDAPLFRLKHRVRTWIQKDTDVEWHRTYLGWKQLLESARFETGLPKGADILPGLGQMMPEKCWSLVFTAHKS